MNAVNYLSLIMGSSYHGQLNTMVLPPRTCIIWMRKGL